tara:strand:+ start:139 stop:927 length:789 start_codon:yes stop_codon:yes gene_type:complete
MSVLKEICDKKLLELKDLKKKTSESELINLIKLQKNPIGFKKALDQSISINKYGLIAEIKKASPSKGIIKKDFKPLDIAKAYKNGGATCLSILTEKNWFKGSIDYLTAVKKSIDIPILRKDFILDPWQVLETRSIGADCILIILSAVDDYLAEELYSASKDIYLDVLVEAHDEIEIERALKLKPDLIGINNRNLKTLKIDLNNTVNLSKLIPNKCDIVCESGLNTNKDLREMEKLGINRFLVGESLMKNTDIENATKNLLQK